MIILNSGLNALKLHDNEVEAAHDGGRVTLVADATTLDTDTLVEGPEKLSNITVVMNYRRDEPMRKWPHRKEERLKRRFTLLILEDLTDEQLAKVVKLLT